MNTVQQAVREFEEAGYGVSKPKVIAMDSSDSIKDKYNVQSEIDRSKLTSEEKDESTQQREDFLKIYKEEAKKPQPEQSDKPNSQIRFRNDESEEPDFKLNTSAAPVKKPLITEIGSGPAVEEAIKLQPEVEAPFSWANAIRLELRPQFIA